jgi:hypothetical protein
MLSLLEQTALVARELEDNLVNLRVLWKREFALLARTTTRYKNLRNPNTTSMTISTHFRFLEHTADVYIAAYGKNLKEAFENAAAAMFETMTNLNQITPTKKDTVHTNQIRHHGNALQQIQNPLSRTNPRPPRPERNRLG